MKFIVSKVCDYGNQETVDINTIDELLYFVEQKRNEAKEDARTKGKTSYFFEGVIIDKNNEGEWILEIYDNYRE